MVKRKGFKMKKLILIVCAAAAFAALAAETGDSYLYWMVGDTITMEGSDGQQASYSYDKLTARVVAYDANTGTKSEFLNLYGQSETGALVPVSGGTKVTVNGMNSPFYAGIASSMTAANWSYFIELYNESTFVGRSVDSLDYPTAQSMAFLKGSDLNPGKYWNVAAFTPKPVPEPSSGLLLLLGVAGLALRRRKQIAA